MEDMDENRLEPEVFNQAIELKCIERYTMSIAISLKRIADAVDRFVGLPEEIVADVHEEEG